MSRPFSLQLRERRGFTLIELMVSMAVLVVLVLLIAQLADRTVGLTTRGRKTLDADSEARLVFDRIGADLARMVRRDDVDYVLKGSENPANAQAGDDVIAFFGETSGYYGGSTPIPATEQRTGLSVVGFRMVDGALHRLAKGLGWGTSAQSSGREIVFLPTRLSGSGTGAWPQILADPPDTDYQVLGSQILRFEYWYQLKDGTYSSRPSYSTSAGVNNFRDVQAIVVSIAVLDEKSRVLAGLDNASRLRDPSGWDSKMTSVRAALLDFVPSSPASVRTNLPAAWNDAIQSGALTSPTGPLPAAASAALRVYTRAFPLDTL